jgi:HEPN domain-containing protein
MMEREHAELLMFKASQDEAVMDQLAKSEDLLVEAYGFHAQQAAEKLLKAAIVAAGSDYPFTHRLEELIELIKKLGIVLPTEFETLDELTPFAIELRYDVYPAESESKFDHQAMRKWIADLRAWVEGYVASRLHSKK